MRTAARRTAIAALAILSVGNMASAEDDSGVHAFLSNAFGQAGSAGAAPQAAPEERSEPRQPVATQRGVRIAHVRPLTVRRQQPPVVAGPGPMPTDVKVSILNDPTLRAGDAVMTADGIRVFAGSRSWPYAKSDFVPIAQARDLSRDAVQVLAGLDSAPRS